MKTNISLFLLSFAIVLAVWVLIWPNKPTTTEQQINKQPVKLQITNENSNSQLDTNNQALANTTNNSSAVVASDQEQFYACISTNLKKALLDTAKNTLKVPFNHCGSEYGCYSSGGNDSCVDGNTVLNKINLSKHSLPLDKITAIIISQKLDKIAYTIYDSTKKYCKDDKEGFIYDLETKQTQQINAQDTINICGATSAHIMKFSPQGRFLYIEASGETEAYMLTLYDTKKEEEFKPNLLLHPNDDFPLLSVDEYAVYGKNEEYVIFPASSDNSCMVNGYGEMLCMYDSIVLQNVDSQKSRFIVKPGNQHAYKNLKLNGSKLTFTKYKVNDGNFTDEQTITINLNNYLK